MRCLISGDSPVVASGLKHILLETLPDLDTREIKPSEIFRCVHEFRWDLLIFSPSPHSEYEPSRTPDGLETIQQILELCPELPILIFAEEDQSPDGISYLKAGAHGYLNLSASTDEVLLAVNTVIAGRTYLNKTSSDQLTLELRGGNQRSQHATLSEREYAVMLRIARGEALKEIAQNLQLSPKTVSTYRRRVLRKIKEHSNAGLTLYALRNRLIS
jgi:DNA-binding NarL/FixJ family response regulator